MNDHDVSQPFAPQPTETLGTTKCHSVPSYSPDTKSIDLVAAVIGIEGEKARRILCVLGGISSIASATETELVAAGVTQRKARHLRHVLELARLAIGQRPIRGQRLAGASDVWTHMRARLSAAPVEEFWAIALDVRHRVLFDEMLARGSLTSVEIHPRDIFRPLIKAGAAAVLFTHNHPSGDPSPSRADIELTTRLREVGDLCGIPVLDHVVVGAEGFVSLAERNWR